MSTAIAWAERRLTWLSIAAALTGTATVAAAGSAPYALPAGTAQQLVANLATSRDAALEGLRTKLDTLDTDLGAEAAPAAVARSRGATTATERMSAEQLAAHLQQLSSLRRDLMQTVQAAHLAAGSTQADQVNAQIRERFTRLENALQAVAEAKTQPQAAEARAHLRRLLRNLRPPERQSAALEPNLRQFAPQNRVRQAPASKVLPAYALDSLRDEPGRSGVISAGLQGSGQTPFDQPWRLIRTSAPQLAPATGTDCSAVAADTAADGAEIQLTDDIKALAQSLGYSPVQMLAWMQKNIQFQAYWGSMKGATGALQTRAGNATDQASLLIALLRSANIPARYVRGTVAIVDAAPSDNATGKAQRWLGTKNYSGSALALAAVSGTGLQLGNDVQGVAFKHVWVQACVPYAGYRGTATEAGGYRWLALDPSIKDQDYQAGMAVNLPLDSSFYGPLLARRSDDLPTDYLASRVEALARNQRADASVEDVPYRGTPKALRMDVLPGTPPFTVLSFSNWSGTTTPDTAVVPDSHRLKLTVKVMQPGASSTLASTTLSLPSQVFAKLTVSYAPNAASQQAWNAWSGTQAAAPAGSVSVYPRLLVDGVEVSNGAGQPLLALGGQHNLVMKFTGGDYIDGQCMADTGDAGSLDTDPSCINKTVYKNLQAGAYYALGFNAAQISPALLQSRSARLATNVTANPSAPTPAAGNAYDATVGELLHLVVESYIHETDLAKTRIAELNGARNGAWFDLGLTGSELQTLYAFDLPVVVKPSGVFVDFKGGRFGYTKLASGAPVVAGSGESAAAFTARRTDAAKQETSDLGRLTIYASSALEHHVWQQVLRTDAVSTVRGLQFANESGISVLNLTLADRNNLNTLLDLSTGIKASIGAALDGGANVTVAKSQIAYTDPVDPSKAWRGAVYMTENAAKGEYGALIDGGLSGGYPLINSAPVSSLFNANPNAPSFADLSDQGLGRLTTLPTGQQGSNSLATMAGDPVN